MKNKPQTLDGDVMTMKETAAYLKVDKSMVRKMIDEGKLSAIRIGSGPNARFRISSASIEKLLGSTRH